MFDVFSTAKCQILKFLKSHQTQKYKLQNVKNQTIAIAVCATQPETIDIKVIAVWRHKSLSFVVRFSLHQGRSKLVNSKSLDPEIRRWCLTRIEYILEIWSPGSKICNRRVKTAVLIWFRLFIDSDEWCNTVNAPSTGLSSIQLSNIPETLDDPKKWRVKITALRRMYGATFYGRHTSTHDINEFVWYDLPRANVSARNKML